MTGRHVGAQVEPRVDLDEEGKSRLVEGPDREALPEAGKERHPAQRAGADLTRADELEDRLRPAAALELRPAERDLLRRVPRPPERRLRVAEPRLGLTRNQVPRV